MGHHHEIRGHTYDTDFAEFVAASSDLDEGGEGTETGLYLTDRGDWFLVVHPTERPSGAVVPLTALQAEQWCEQHGIDEDVISLYFDTPRDPTDARDTDELPALLRSPPVVSATEADGDDAFCSDGDHDQLDTMAATFGAGGRRCFEMHDGLDG
jgi:hypothetical protein